MTSPWPEGVKARYLNLGGALVNYTPNSTGAAAICGGCDERCDEGGSYSRDTHRRKVKEWAQAHAERCRAIPKPNEAGP